MESQSSGGKLERPGACTVTEVEGREGDMILPLTVKCRSWFDRPVCAITDKNGYDSQNSADRKALCLSFKC